MDNNNSVYCDGMLEIILIAIIGSALAGIWDLKTTEVPDPIPMGMAAIGVLYWTGNWVVNSDASSLFISLIVGTALLAAGLLLYRKGQWGGADAWILAAIGYMIPVYNGSIFILPYLLNFMIVSIVYTVVYSIIVGLLHINVFRHVAKDFKQNAKIIVGIIGGAAIVTLLAANLLPNGLGIIRILPLIVLLVLFWRYARVIEKKVFRKKIPVSKLKVGDVLESSKWVGLTEQEVKKLRRTKRFVIVKDGMRFVPVFAITLVLTLLYGNLFFVIF